MTRIAIELDMPAIMAEAAKRQGLLSSPALLELIKRELEKIRRQKAGSSIRLIILQATSPGWWALSRQIYLEKAEFWFPMKSL
jgi:hypothetical protein